MRQHKIVTRTLLILFIVSQVVDFVFGAPVAAREKLEGRIDVDVTEDGTAALQKRVNPMDEWSTNIPGQPEAPSSPDTTELDQLWRNIAEDMLVDNPTRLQIPGWSTPPFREGSSTGSNSGPSSPLPEEGTPLSSGSNPSPHSPPMTLPEEHLPPARTLTIDTPSTTVHQPTPQQSLGPDSDVHPPPNLEPHPPAADEMPTDAFLDMLMKGKIKRTFPAPVNPVRMDPRSQKL
jgi:hypothetical protein